MQQIIHNKIQRAFNASAKSYDLFSGFHREIADKLFVQTIKEIEPSALLDVGCGTGYLTGKLKGHFPQSEIIGLDFSPQMLQEARSRNEGIIWVLADGHHLPFSDGHFDAVISNLAYQWAVDLPRAFREARRVLAPNGVLMVTLFGFNTCQELFQCLEEAKAGAVQFSRLPDEVLVKEALITSRFKDPKVEAERITIEFNSMYELITWLKSIGANHLSRQGYLGPETLARAEAIYRRKFSYHHGVAATFEVIDIYAQR